MSNYKNSSSRFFFYVYVHCRNKNMSKMFSLLIAISLVFVTSNAQEHLTCLRTDDVINSSSQPTSTNIQQGRPGRRGPPGQKGETGLGMKGEPGIPDDSQINSLGDNMTRALLRGYVELNNGWIAPFNGYQYKATPYAQSWDENRRFCQNLQSDLIAYGFRDINIIITIFRGVALSANRYFWIGLTDKASEGTWKWVNGHEADSITRWRGGEPNNSGGNQDCAVSYFSNTAPNGFRVWDYPCSNLRRSICEKLV